MTIQDIAGTVNHCKIFKFKDLKLFVIDVDLWQANDI